MVVHTKSLTKTVYEHLVLTLHLVFLRRPIACKPLFFDLALNHIKVPLDDIAEKAGVNSKKSPSKDSGAGLSGFVKGLWGWGSGK